MLRYWLVNGGIITRNAWGIMTWRSVTGLGNPSDRAAKVLALRLPVQELKPSRRGN